ncbi:MAG: NAD(+)/NADH kinase [Christensenellaceae bacterium]|jgi:NAD+ kinase|nr:NAD(+)/NADH kinase [Christensenellaceae bacterium]
MTIGIFTNHERDINSLATKTLIELISPHNIEVLLCSELKDSGINLEYCESNDELVSRSDIVVIFGGDGTILRIAKVCALHNTKIFAVNLGNIGFLAETEKVDMLEKTRLILNGNYTIENRSILKAECAGVNLGYALNEVVVGRDVLSKLLRCEVYVNNSMLDAYHSDGIIIATPTGSTAYSLSAGGPLVEPDVDAIIVTPICPHTLHSRPLIVKSSKTISVKILANSSDARVNLDGDASYPFKPGNIIKISYADIVAKFIRLKGYDYFAKLREKISYMTLH